MSLFITRMEQLKLLQRRKTGLADRKISIYKKSSIEEQKAMDDNAEILIQSYLNTDLQSIRENVKTLTTITIIYFVISILAGIIILINTSI